MKQEEATPGLLREVSRPTIFDYEGLDGKTRTFVQQKTAETHLCLKRTAEHLVQIGANLLAVKERLPHGHFMAWIEAEFGMSYQTARNCMRVAERFGGKMTNFVTLPSTVLYLLAQSSETIIEQVESGAIAPTRPSIKAAREAEREARAEAERERLQTKRAQEELETAHREAGRREALLQQQLDALQEERKRPSRPEVRTQEVLPPSVQAELETLQHKVEALTGQRDALSRQIEQLGAQARAAALQADAPEEAREREGRARFRTNTTLALEQLARLLIGWPSQIDSYHFAEEDWRRLAQLEDHLGRVQEACLLLRTTVERTVAAQPERARADTEVPEGREDYT